MIATGAPGTTASRATRVLGSVALVGVAVLLLYAFVITPDDTDMGDAVRLLYIHLPSVAVAYTSLLLCAVASAAYLVKRSVWWDLVASSAAEIGVVFVGVTLATGSIWGRPTWGTYWEWGDVRLVTTLVLFLLFCGYLALRQVPADPDVRARRSAVVALVAVLDIPIMNRSVEWWNDRTLHQRATVAKLDPDIDGVMFFAAMVGVAVFMIIFAWLLIHRFRVAWLEREDEVHGLADALVERRAEGLRGLDAGGFA